jgi:N-acetylmuramoyl-L-alanine amidase
MRPVVAAMLVVVDPGHHPLSPGATSATGRPEYLFNQETASAVVRELAGEKNIRVRITRRPTICIGNRRRAAKANAWGASLLLSIHHDSVPPWQLESWRDGETWRFHNETARGFSLLVRDDNPASIEAARVISRSLKAAGFEPTSTYAGVFDTIDAALGIYGRRDLTLLNRATVPAVILECGFISSLDEETALAQPGALERLAKAVAKGVLAALHPEGA